MPFLGRAFEPVLESSIRQAGQVLDELIATSVPFYVKTGQDLAPQIRDLNARLVNEVIIAPNDVSDAAATERLATIETGAGDVRKTFDLAGFPVQAYVPTPKGELTLNVSIVEAQRLQKKLHEAWDRFLGVVDRYAKMRSQLEAIERDPQGGRITPVVLYFGKKLDAADGEIFFAQEFIDQLDKRLAEDPGSVIEILEQTFVRLENWVQGVFMAELVFVRLEGMVLDKPAALSMMTWKDIPWWGFVVAGGVVVATLYALSSRKP